MTVLLQDQCCLGHLSEALWLERVTAIIIYWGSHVFKKQVKYENVLIDLILTDGKRLLSFESFKSWSPRHEAYSLFQVGSDISTHFTGCLIKFACEPNPVKRYTRAQKKYTGMYARRLRDCIDITANLKSYRLYTCWTRTHLNLKPWFKTLYKCSMV